MFHFGLVWTPKKKSEVANAVNTEILKSFNWEVWRRNYTELKYLCDGIIGHYRTQGKNDCT